LSRETKIAAVVFATSSLGLFFLMARAERTVGGVAIGTVLALVAAVSAAFAIRPFARWKDDAPAPRASFAGIAWPVALSVVLVVPTMGVMGLWDPWETNYAEVAREILARNDWISLWWQDEWFHSKPILLFWLEAWAMAILGVNYHSDGQPTAPEWAVRLPTVLLSIGVVVVLAKTARRYWGPRAGVLAAIALASSAYFGFLSHQAITDMPFVSTMTIALAALVVAIHTDESEPAHRFRVPWPGGAREATTIHLVLAAFVLSAWPQILYLVTRNVEILGERFATFHYDEFFAGSAENGRLRPEDPALVFEPALQAAIWLVGLAAGLFAMRKTTSQRSALLWTFYLFVAYSSMAKGIPGFALPGLVALVFLATTGRWSLLRRLHIPAGSIVSATVLLPWFVAMYVRHGPAFTDRLLIHDHVNRLLVGVHGDTGTLRYFLAQLGYGAFPWVALAPAALFAWIPFGKRTLETPAAEARLFFSLAAFLSFLLFAAMVTKFHHYVFPMVPSLALLVAVFADEVTPTEAPTARRLWIAWLAAATAWAASATWLVARIAPGGQGSFVPALVAFAASTALAVVLARRAGVTGGEAPSGTVSVALVAAAVLALVVGRDLATSPTARPRGIELLVNLFIYNYDRQFPAGFDRFYPWLLAFGVVASVVLAVSAVPRLRRAAVHVFAAFSVVFAAWVLYVYMWQLTPHWSQKDFIASYYRERESPDERLVAWQMNWKGENFYTGNRVVVYVSLDNAAFDRWVDRHRGETHFIATERPRLDSLRRTLHKSERDAPVVDDTNNKYILIKTTL
jgi:4-amino-4-deoxy-L-arabinose transferase-like glycosyltransferase